MHATFPKKTGLKTLPHALSRLAAGLLATAVVYASAADLASIQQSGVRVGYAVEVPFAYASTDGTMTGESPEVARALLKRLGAQDINGVLTEWGALVPGLHAGRFDLVASGMYITPARCRQVIFTDPHVKISDTFLVAKGNPKNLRSYADVIQNPSATVTIVAGSIYLNRMLPLGIREAQILQVPDATAQLQAVRAGRADAALTTDLSAREFAARGGDGVEVVEDFQDSPEHVNYIGLALRPADVALRDALNAQLHTWRGSAEHLQTVAPFGFDASNIPQNKTAAQLCGQS